VTDGERILGLGDQRYWVAWVFPNGNCLYYTAAVGGISPCLLLLPVMLDVGTNNEKFIG